MTGVFILFGKKEKIESWLLFFVALSTGTLVGGAFIHLLPEAQELFGNSDYFYIVILSFSFFFLIEKFLHWHHCHNGECEEHTFGYMNLVGDGVHNFIDGLIIAAAFLVDIRLGFTTGIAIAIHEIPQEVGDIGVLLHAGFTRTKAIVSNLLIALMSVFGGLVGYFFASKTDTLTMYLLPFAAGGFIYIAMSDLMPEIKSETSLKKSAISFAVFILGVGIMYLLTFLG